MISHILSSFGGLSILLVIFIGPSWIKQTDNINYNIYLVFLEIESFIFMI